MRVFAARLGRGIQKHRGTGGGGFEGLRPFERVQEDTKQSFCFAQNGAAVCLPCVRPSNLHRIWRRRGASNLVLETQSCRKPVTGRAGTV